MDKFPKPLVPRLSIRISFLNHWSPIHQRCYCKRDSSPQPLSISGATVLKMIDRYVGWVCRTGVSDRRVRRAAGLPRPRSAAGRRGWGGSGSQHTTTTTIHSESQISLRA